MRDDLMQFPYMDPTLPVEARLDDLLARMTLAEKVRQMDIYNGAELGMEMHDEHLDGFDGEEYARRFGEVGVGCLQARFSNAKLNNQVQAHHIRTSRLGIPILFSEETLHGLVWPEATIFPQQVALAGTFDPAMAYRQGRAIATEARAQGVHEGFAPVMDLARDVRWGRVEEGYGEDTHLSARFAAEMVCGLQGDDLKNPDTIVAEPKHFTGYGAPYGGLNCAPALWGRHEHAFYCLPVFEAAIQAGALNVMCSYNAIDGVPVAGDHSLLTGVLREEWGMQGFVRADMTAVAMLHTCHFTAETPRDAIRQGVVAGVDMQLYDFPHDVYQDTLADLVYTGEIAESVIDTACRRILRVKMLLGLFERPLTDEGLAAQVVNCPAHKGVARDVARKAICLLKNQGDLLPLQKDISTIAVLGPSAAVPRFGDYSPAPSVARAVTLLDGIRAAVSPDTRVTHAAGCSILDTDITPLLPHWLRDREGNRGLTGEYFNALDFSGEPVHVRTDLTIQFNFIYSKPAPGVNADRFSVRWTGTMTPTESFTGCLGLSSNDSMRLWVDGELIVDGWGDRDANRMVDFTFERGRAYDIRVEYTNDQRGVRVICGFNHGRVDMEEAVHLACEADVAIVAVGDSEETSGENLDRADLNLPGRQLDLVKAIHATGTPVVLVLQNGRPLSLTWESEHLPAIVEGWHIGEQAGTALAEVLFGDVNPAGRLPFAFPKSVGQIPVNYNRTPFGGTKYVEMDWNPLYPFGYGLSYTTFEYSNLRLSAREIAPDGTLEVLVDVTNTGRRAGDEVVQLYLHDTFSSTVRPYQELAGFERITLQPGETRTVRFTLGERQLRVLTADFRWVVEPGSFEVMVGDNATNLLLRDEFVVR